MGGIFGGLLGLIDRLGRSVLAFFRVVLIFLIGKSGRKWNIDGEKKEDSLIRIYLGSAIVFLPIGFVIDSITDFSEMKTTIISLTIFFAGFAFFWVLELIRRRLETENDHDEDKDRLTK